MGNINQFIYLPIMWVSYISCVTAINVANISQGNPVVGYGFVIEWWFVTLVMLSPIILGILYDYSRQYLGLEEN